MSTVQAEVTDLQPAFLLTAVSLPWKSSENNYRFWLKLMFVRSYTNKPNHFFLPSTAFISLLDNYESDTGEPEIVTPEEVAENHKFLDSIIKSQTMKVVWKK